MADAQFVLISRLFESFHTCYLTPSPFEKSLISLKSFRLPILTFYSPPPQRHYAPPPSFSIITPHHPPIRPHQKNALENVLVAIYP